MQSNLNNANVGMQGNINNANATLAGANMQGQQNVLGGLENGVGGFIGTLASPGVNKAQGGMIGSYGAYADGGTTGAGPLSAMGQFMTNMGNSMNTPDGPSALQTGTSNLFQGLGKIFAPAAPQPVQSTMPTANDWAAYANAPGTTQSDQNASMMGGPSTVSKAHGGNVGSKLKTGGGVPGKAKAKGNSYSNDTVKALLSPGELVVDRETMSDGGPAGQAARFLAAVIAAKKRGGK
jgi:hypothetical protein